MRLRSLCASSGTHCLAQSLKTCYNLSAVKLQLRSTTDVFFTVQMCEMHVEWWYDGCGFDLGSLQSARQTPITPCTAYVFNQFLSYDICIYLYPSIIFPIPQACIPFLHYPAPHFVCRAHLILCAVRLLFLCIHMLFWHVLTSTRRTSWKIFSDCSRRMWTMIFSMCALQNGPRPSPWLAWDWPVT